MMETGTTSMQPSLQVARPSERKAPSILFCDNNYLALQYDPWFKSGGATKQVVAWVEGLRALGVEAKVLGAHQKADFFREREEIIVSYDPTLGVPKLRYLYVRMPGILRAFSKMKPDCIYYGIPSPFAGVLALCARMRKTRFILRVSNDFFVDGRAEREFDPLREFLFRLGFRLADCILCQNTYQFDRVEERYPGKARKLTNPFSGSIVETPVSFAERNGVAWAGIFQRQKNLPLLLEIARSLPETPFRIAGGHDKPLSVEDQAALGELRLLPNVTFLGFLKREEVLALMGSSRLLLNTSHYEGFSNTFLEAFSRGTPVMTLPQNDPDRIIQKYRLGEVISEAGSMAARVRGLLHDEVRFAEYSGNCLRYMKDHHDLAKQAGKLLNILFPKS